MEVSSHGINQARINNFKFDIVGLTNLGSDHLDFHLCKKNYHSVKSAFLLKNTGVLKIFIPIKYIYRINFNKKIYYYKVNKRLFKNFNVIKYDYNNLYLALKILIQMNYRKKDILNSLYNIKLNNGRGEIITHNNRKIIIDYAHHVESFKSILKDNNYNKVVIFGCGGNRDKSKRNIMGKIACKYCKYVIITTDNPRNENLNDINNDITKYISNYEIINDRYEAINYAINKYSNLDIYILGKGDESFIEYKDDIIPFNDKEIVNKIINLD